MRLRVYGEKEEMRVDYWESFNRYFSFVAMWEKLEEALNYEKENPRCESEWLKSYYEFSIIVCEDCRIFEDDIRNAVVYLSKDEEMNTFVYKNGKIDLNESQYKTTHKDFFDKNEGCIDEIIKSCKDMTPQAFNAFWAFLIFHLQSGCNIMENELDRKEDSVALIKEIMRNRNFRESDSVGKAAVFVKDNLEEWELPFVDEDDKKQKMELVSFYKTGGAVTELYINGARKLLFPGEKVWAVRRGKGYTAFLPSVAVSGNAYMIMENGVLTLCIANDDKTVKKLNVGGFLKGGEPVMWVFSLEKDAVAAISEDGSIESVGQIGGEKPEVPAIKLCLSGEYYAVLDKTGTIYNSAEIDADFSDCIEGVAKNALVDDVKSRKMRVYREKSGEWKHELFKKEGNSDE